MTSPILSRDEIEALLRKGSSPSDSDELHEILQYVAQNMTAQVNRRSVEPLELEGPYAERLGKTLEQSIHDESYVVAVELGDIECLLLMNIGDATLLAERLQISVPESMQLLGQAWTSEFAELAGISYRVYQAQSFSISAMHQMELQPQSYLVRHAFKRYAQRFEFYLVIQQSEYLETLVRVAKEKIGLMQAKETAKGLLKGNESKSPVTRAAFTPIDEIAQLEEDQSITLLEDIDLMVTVELGHTTLTLNEILDLQPQSVISLEQHAGEPVDVYVNETKSAKAEVVVLEDNFGVRILEILPKSKRF
ncbi:MAG TPA: flagellar motor switch protein FliN [Limnochordia bacterium]|nr:flagellar motor switch protein FliN [Limnochordia bacterium]